MLMFETIDAFNDYMNNRFEMFHTFLEYDDIPILYVMTSKDTLDGEDFYLCDCVEFRNEQIILMTYVSREVLEDLVNRSITVYDVLTKRGSGLISIVTRGFKTTIENTNPFKVPMPSRDSYISLTDDEKKEFMHKLANTTRFI